MSFEKGKLLLHDLGLNLRWFITGGIKNICSTIHNIVLSTWEGVFLSNPVSYVDIFRTHIFYSAKDCERLSDSLKRRSKREEFLIYKWEQRLNSRYRGELFYHTLAIFCVINPNHMQKLLQHWKAQLSKSVADEDIRKHPQLIIGSYFMSYFKIWV